MVHDQHVFTHGMYLPFCPAQSLLCVYPVWVHSQCSLEVLKYFFQFFRCRNLALNRVFFLLFSGKIVFILGGMVGCPLCLCTPCTFVHPLYVCTPPYVHMPPGVYTPHGPPILSVLLHSFGALYVVGGLFFCLMCIGIHHPYLGVPPPYPPTLLYWLPVHCYSQGYQFLCGGLSPSIEGFGGCFPHYLGRFGEHISSLLFTCSFLYIFCSALCLTSRPRL